jgi:hypothetical protein
LGRSMASNRLSSCFTARLRAAISWAAVGIDPPTLDPSSAHLPAFSAQSIALSANRLKASGSVGLSDCRSIHA